MTRHWAKSYGDTIPAKINADAFPSVVALFEIAMKNYADKTAFHSLGASLSYAEVDQRSRDFAAYLQSELGVKKGDRIALMVPNILAFPIVMIGILRAGAVQVNVNPLYTPHELEHQLNDSGAEIMVIYSGSTPTLAAIVDNTPVKTVVTVDLGDGGPNTIPSPPVDARFATSLGLKQALITGADLAFDVPEIIGADNIFLQYTGGTTGLSKGATLTHRNLIANVEQTKAMIPDALVPGEEIVITALPLYHIFALMVNFVTYFSIGSENHLIANPRDPQMLVGPFKTSGFSVATGVNTLIEGLANVPGFEDFDFSNFKVMLGGGSPVLATTSAKWRKVTGKDVLEGYGLSETSPIVSVNPMTIDGFSGTVGLPVPSTDIILLDDNDVSVGIGEAGEICVKGPQVMTGYWNRPDATAEAFTKDGYFRTGDIGEFDERGFLKIVDRKKDMILVSGFNVYPNEIEAHVAGMSGVAESACVGVASKKTGEAVCLYVVKTQDADIDEAAVIAFCREGLAGYKVPKQIHFIAELPKSGVGKILRRELRDGAA